MKKPKRILLSFVGSNDAGKLKNKDDGAILTALTNQQFDEVILLWNKSGNKEIDYLMISKHLTQEIKLRKLAKKSTIVEFPISNVTDHNQIYKSLKKFTDDLDKSLVMNYTAAISSGTPAMQVCWILLSESGDFSESNRLNLIQVKDPKFGASENVPVKIDTALPKIIRLKEEVETLKKDLIPSAIITINRPGVKIGEVEMPFTPIELCYFKYFADRVVAEKGYEKFPVYSTTNDFVDRIIEIHQEFFPDSDSGRQDLVRIRKKNMGLDITTFRGNISKLNKKIQESINNSSIAETFKVRSEGVKGAKCYGITVNKEKILIES